jgi:glucokinase
MKKTFYLGIDVGGSKIRGVLLNKSRNQRPFAFQVKTPKNRKLFLEILEKEVRKTLQKRKIIGIGIGLPGIVDVRRGLFVKAPNLPFLNGWQAKKFFKKFRVKTKFDNDSRCFLRAEAFLGAGKKYKNIIALTVGTGIGGGIMINRKIYYGEKFGAGEFGHMIINNKGTLEKLGGKEAFLKKKDYHQVIGVGIADLVNAFDPEIVILGGSPVMNGSIKIKKLKKIAQKSIMSPLAKKTPIIKGKLGEYSQAIGAALLMKIK